MKYAAGLESKFEYSSMLQVFTIKTSTNHSPYLRFSLQLHGAGVQNNISNRRSCDPCRNYSSSMKTTDDRSHLLLSQISHLAEPDYENDTWSAESSWVAIILKQAKRERDPHILHQTCCGLPQCLHHSALARWDLHAEGL